MNAARQQLERFPRRQTQSQTSLRDSHANSTSGGSSTLMLNPSPVLIQQTSNAPHTPVPQSQYLLVGLLEELSLQDTTDLTRQDRSQFVQELVLSSTVHRRGGDDEEEPQVEESAETNKVVEVETPKMGDCVSDTAPDLTSAAANDETEEENRPTRQGTVVLRGRARSDRQNSKRRAEANRFEFGPEK